MMRSQALRNAVAAGVVCCVSLAAQAALFEDDEARRAILDLRQRVGAACSICKTRSKPCAAMCSA